MHEHAVDPTARLPCSGDQAGVGRPWEHGHQEAMMSDTIPIQPAIARIWRGRTRRDRADEYEAYNHGAGIKPLIEKALAVQTLREDREHETEFMTISYWESIEAMRRFTGSDPTRIHHLERDEEFLIELPRKVQVLHLRQSYGMAYARQK
jgi:hypothetical protein